MNNITLKELLTMTQDEIKAKALSIPDAYEITEGNVFIKGSLPLVLVAHMDTVYGRTPKASEIIEKNGNLQTKKHCGVGIGGDDRCGCWILFQVAEWNKEDRPSLLFCSDEETCAGSSVGLNKLDWSEYKAFIEIDAPNYGVFYSGSSSNDVLNSFMCDVIGLHELSTSYNDITEICTVGNPAGVTLGAGYYNQHSKNKERISLFGLNVVLNTVQEICSNLDVLDWSVVPAPKEKKKGTKTTSYTSAYYDYDYKSDHYYDYWGDDDDDDDNDFWNDVAEEAQEAFYDGLAIGCDPANGSCEICDYAIECENLAEWNKLNKAA